jgi:hypothetical protein
VGLIAKLGDRQVPGVVHPDDLDPEVGEDAEQTVPPLPDAIVPFIGAALDGENARNPEHAWVSQCQERIQIASVESIYALAVALDVLLRHRYSRSPTASMASCLSQ